MLVLNLFLIAKDIGTLSIGYVWIVANWLFSVLDSDLLEADDARWVSNWFYDGDTSIIR
jgi:hypothetical protein